MKEVPSFSEDEEFTIARANETVWKHVKKDYVKSHERLLAEMNEAKEACGCKSCKFSVVREFNSWTDWIAGEDADRYPHYRVNDQLKIEEYIPLNEEKGYYD